jgi:hypothetical protein
MVSRWNSGNLISNRVCESLHAVCLEVNNLKIASEQRLLVNEDNDQFTADHAFEPVVILIELNPGGTLLINS